MEKQRDVSSLATSSRIQGLGLHGVSRRSEMEVYNHIVQCFTFYFGYAVLFLVQELVPASDFDSNPTPK